MEAKHLMIGDWAIINENHPACPFTRKLDIGDLSFFTHFEPIPLTPEILEKNGLKYEVDYGGYHRSILGSHSKDNEPLICVQWNPQGEISQWEVSNKSGILTGVVAYGYTTIAVHQLQQILRLCGLEELADNFQI